MPGLDVGNVFKSVLNNPLTAAGNWFGGGLSRVAEGGDNEGDLQFLADTMRTGQAVTEEPRTGLLSFIAPTVRADPRTQYMEQVLLHQRAQEDLKTKIGAIGVFEDLVDQVGGDRAIKMAPAVFGDILKDPDILQAFAGVHAKSRDTEQQRFIDQQVLQEQAFQHRKQYLDYEKELGAGPFRASKAGQEKAPFEDAPAKNIFTSLMKPGASLDPAEINANIDKAKKFMDVYTRGRGKDPTHALSDALDAIKAEQPPVDTRSWWARHFGPALLGTGTAEAEPSTQPNAEATPNLGF